MGRNADSGTESLGALLRRYRGRVGLTQEELAERAGVHAQEISQLERGVIRRPRSTTVEFLADALKLDAQGRATFVAAARGESASSATLVSDLEPTSRSSVSATDATSLFTSIPTDAVPLHGALPAGSRMPLAANPLFVGRGDELLQVAKALRGRDTAVALGQVVASTGLGGLGKTQLAVEFVHRYGSYFAGGVYWLTFSSGDEIPLQVAACAAPEFESRSLEERVRRVTAAWQSGVPRLLVFDNCEEEALLEAWRPPTGGCRVLITSRRSRWSPTLGVTALPLDLLPRRESIELLRRYRPDLAPDDPRLHAIAAELGDLPLALHLAGSYLRAYQTEVCLDDYLAELRSSAVVRHASLLGTGLEDTPNPTRHIQSVAQTFALCLGRLDRDREADQAAIALLARMACMAPGEPVPRDLLVRTLEDVEARQRTDGLRRLAAVGLVEEGDGWLRLHRLLVHFVRLERLDPEAQPAVELVLIGCGEAARQGQLTGPALSAVMPHLVDVACSDKGDEPRQATLSDAAGMALLAAGDVGSARSWLEHALAIRERALGSEHPDTATSLGNLGWLLTTQGELAGARRLYERALTVRERLLGADHCRTAETLNDLALLLLTQGEPAAARPLLDRALAIRERLLGPNHPETAESLNNVALQLWAQGELAAARPLLERALATSTVVLGPGHPNTAMSLNNVARLLHDQGELSSARPLLERALAIWENVLGPDHPSTALGLNNLGRLLRDQGELAAARALVERALSIRERVLGPDHRDTAQSLNNLALLLQDQGDLAAARPLFQRALAIHEKVLGRDHHRTATCYLYLARLLQAQGDPAAARPLLERALAIRERVLAPDHPDTVATRRALAELDG